MKHEQRPGSGRPAQQFRQQLEAAKSESVAQLLFKAARLWNEQAITRLQRESGFPVRVSHTQLLPHIDLDGTRQSELAARLGVSKQAVGQLVEELEVLGVLARIPDPADGRARLVVFTAAGRASMLSGLKLLTEMQQELSAEIGEQHMRQLHRALQRLVPALERAAGRAETA